MTEHSLDQRLASLQREMPPGRDLWPGIEQRINADTQAVGEAGQGASARGMRSSRYGWLALAAGLLVVVAVGRVFLPGQTVSPDVSLAAATNLELRALDQALASPQTTPDLHIAQQQQGGWLVLPTGTSPMAIRVWQPELMAGLQENQQAIATLRDAIRQQPQQTGLLRQLARAERRQHRLLRQWADFNALEANGILSASTTIDSGEQHV